jgi:hypothetical protein
VAVPVSEPAGMLFKQYYSSEFHYLLCSGILSNNFVIFIQAAVILKTGPGGNRHVAVPVSGTAIFHFMPTSMSEMYITMTGILYITLFYRSGSQKTGILRSGIVPAFVPAAPTALGDIPGCISAGNSA